MRKSVFKRAMWCLFTFLVVGNFAAPAVSSEYPYDYLYMSLYPPRGASGISWLWWRPDTYAQSHVRIGLENLGSVPNHRSGIFMSQTCGHGCWEGSKLREYAGHTYYESLMFRFLNSSNGTVDPNKPKYISPLHPHPVMTLYYKIYSYPDYRLLSYKNAFMLNYGYQ